MVDINQDAICMHAWGIKEKPQQLAQSTSNKTIWSRYENVLKSRNGPIQEAP